MDFFTVAIFIVTINTGVIVLVISNRPRASHLANLTLLARASLNCKVIVPSLLLCCHS